MVDELYLQLLRHLRGSNKNTSVRGWELLLLAACACRYWIMAFTFPALILSASAFHAWLNSLSAYIWQLERLLLLMSSLRLS